MREEKRAEEKTEECRTQESRTSGSGVERKRKDANGALSAHVNSNAVGDWTGLDKQEADGDKREREKEMLKG